MGRRLVPLPDGADRFWVVVAAERVGKDLVFVTEADGRIGWTRCAAIEAKRFPSKRDADRFCHNRVPALARATRFTVLPTGMQVPHDLD